MMYAASVSPEKTYSSNLRVPSRTGRRAARSSGVSPGKCSEKASAPGSENRRTSAGNVPGAGVRKRSPPTSRLLGGLDDLREGAGRGELPDFRPDLLPPLRSGDEDDEPGDLRDAVAPAPHRNDVEVEFLAFHHWEQLRGSACSGR